MGEPHRRRVAGHPGLEPDRVGQPAGTENTTTLTATTAALSGGVTAANGLKFGASSGGVISKLDSQVWSGVRS